MRIRSLCSGRWGTLKSSTPLSRSRAQLAMWRMCWGPLRRGRPLTIMYASPIVSTCGQGQEIHYRSWCHKSPVTWLFSSLFKLATNKTSKVHITGPLWEEFVGDRWIPSQGPLLRKVFLFPGAIMRMSFFCKRTLSSYLSKELTGRQPNGSTLKTGHCVSFVGLKSDQQRSTSVTVTS